MWMLVLGAGIHKALVLSSSRKWFQTPQQNRTEKELTREGANSAKQPKALEGGAALPRRRVQMARDDQMRGSPG